MTDTRPDFGQLRSLLNQPASPENFRRVMAMFQNALEANKDVVIEQWVPYLNHYTERYHQEYPPKLYIDGFTWDWEIYDPLIPKDDDDEDLHPDISISIPEIQLQHVQTFPLPNQDDAQIEWIRTIELPNFKQLAKVDSEDTEPYLEATLHGINAHRVELLNVDRVDMDTFLEILSRTTKPLTNLHTLSIQYANLDANQITELGNHHQRLPALKRIDLRGNDFGDDGFKALFESQLWPQLTHLGLNNVRISSESFDQMLRLNKAQPLRYLALNNNDDMSYSSLELMATSDVVRDLTFLDVSNIFPDEHMIDLLVKIPFRQLDRLHVSQMPFSADRMDLLGQWPSLKSVRHLSLYESEQNSVTLAALLQHPNVGNLRFLDIDENHITKTMLTKISRSKHLSNLEALEIGFLDDVAFEDVNSILKAKRLPKLKYVVLEDYDDNEAIENGPFTYKLSRADNAYFGDF